MLGKPEPPYIFVSYASADRARVLQLVARLQAAGVRVWIDLDGISGGTNYSQEIVEGIKGSAGFLLFSSAASLASRNVQREIALAWKYNRPYVPLRLDSAPAAEDLEYWLEGVQWIDVLDQETDVWLPRTLAALARLGVPVAPAEQMAAAAPPTEHATPRIMLPNPPTALLGREAEVAEVGALLLRPEVRLLTLTGPGGIGKTRLAIAVGQALAADFADGVVFVDLASVRDPKLVAPEIVGALGLRPQGDRSLEEQLAAALNESRLLLILDNFEQVLDAAPSLAALLARTSALTLLVTSRAALHLRAEHDYPIAPLDLPDTNRVASLDELAATGAIALFVERAQLAKPGFALDDDNAQAVAEIVRRLDGIPLAIELAAARVKLLPPVALLQRLESRLPLLTGGARDLPRRQQTLRATIEWSLDLLMPEQQRLFRRLAVFAGGWQLEAAEAIAGDGLDVLDGLAALVDQSLVVERDQPGGEPRFFMLETIREFARELLAGSDEAHAIHDSHSRCFALLADQDAERLTADEKAAWFERLDQESANLSAALDWAIARADIQLGIPLILALCEIQWNRVRTIEAQSQIAAVLSWLDLSAQPAKHIRLLQWAFAFARIQGDFDGARALGLQALEIARAMGEPNQVASTLSLLGDLAYREGDNAAARRLLEEALAIQRGRGKPAELASTLLSLAMTLYLDGELDQAQVPIKEDIDIQRDIGPTAELGSALQPYAWILTDQGQFTAARDCLREARSVFERVHMGTGLLWTVEGTARLAAARGEAELAVRLAGATRTLRQTMHVPLPQSIQLDFDHHLATCREQLGETAFRAAWDDGAHLTYEEATAEASAYLDRT